MGANDNKSILNGCLPVHCKNGVRVEELVAKHVLDNYFDLSIAQDKNVRMGFDVLSESPDLQFSHKRLSIGVEVKKLTRNQII